MPGTAQESKIPSTRWSVILQAGEGSREALEHLCARYWRPIYAYVRRSGRAHHDAEDLTQGFFEYVLEGDVIGKADPARGRFRAFIRVCLRNFLAGEHRRGGGRRVLSLDVEGAEQMLAGAPGETPEALFDRLWAVETVHRAMRRLREESAPQAWEAFALAGGTPPPSHREIGSRIGLTEDAVAQSLARTRRKFRELLIEEVRSTLEDETKYEDELASLRQAISASGAAPGAL